MSDSSNNPHANRSIAVIVGAVVTALVTISGGLAGAYAWGYQMGKDVSSSDCRSAKDDLDSTKRKYVDSQSDLQNVAKNLEGWRTAYENSQKTIVTQTSQISDLTTKVKSANVCAFLQQQAIDFQFRLDSYQMSDDKRKELLSERSEVLTRMEPCTRL